MSKIRVLVVDDSVVIRKVVSEELAKDPEIEVVGTASNGQLALARMTQLNPDLVILDIEMPEMDGLTALRQIKVTHPKTPVIMFSSLTERGAKETLEALALGASDYFPKPAGSGGLEESRSILRKSLIPAIRELTKRNRDSQSALAPTKFSSPPVSAAPTRSDGPAARFPPASRVDVVAIGASTGGPNALAEIFAAFPKNPPVPILVVQHMPPMFTRLLADRLTKHSPLTVVEAAGGEELAPGKAWIAPGDFHLTVVREGTRVRTHIDQNPAENSCRPAVDPLFRSVASVFGANVLAIVLTGMGQDGLRGCEAIVAARGQVLIQDEASSVVWGMPGFVARAGLAHKVLPISLIAGEIIRRVGAGRG